MDFASMLGNIFKREEVPMAPNPSIVKLDEGQELIMNRPQMQTPDSAMTHGPNGIFGDIYGQAGGANAEYPMGEQVQAPVVPQVPTNMNDYAMTPEMAVPRLPPEQNETVKAVADMMGVPPVPEEGTVPDPAVNQKRAQAEELAEKMQGYIDGLPENDPQRPLIEGNLESLRNEIEDGLYDDPSTGYVDRRQSQGTPEEEAADTVRENVDRAQGKKVVGYENQGNLDGPEREAVDSAVNEALDTAPDGTTKVEIPSGTIPVTKKDVEDVKKEDPAGWEKAMSWITRTFGVTGQDLARFGLLYAGSRLAGYDHQGSMSWSFEVAGTDLVERRSMEAQITQTGKYTPASIQDFHRTGDFSKLKPLGDKDGGLKIDATAPAYKKGTQELVYKATDGSGNKYYVDGKGNRYMGDVWDPEKDEGTAKDIRDGFVGNGTKVITEVTAPKKGEDAWYSGSPTADAQIAYAKVKDYSDANGIPPDGAAVSNILRGAALAAEEDYRRSGVKVTDLEPYISRQLIITTSKEAWAGAFRQPNGAPLSGEESGQLLGIVMSVVKSMDGYAEAVARTSEDAVLDVVMKDLHKDYMALPDDERKRYKGGFPEYLKKATLNPN